MFHECLLCYNTFRGEKTKYMYYRIYNVIEKNRYKKMKNIDEVFEISRFWCPLKFMVYLSIRKKCARLVELSTPFLSSRRWFIWDSGPSYQKHAYTNAIYFIHALISFQHVINFHSLSFLFF